MSNSADISILEIVEPTEKIVLFNGKDLYGWFSDIPARDEDPSSPDIVEVTDGVIVTPGKAVGHLVSEKSFRNYRLEVDYRLSGEGGGGSILVHVSKLRMLRTKSKNIFPQSLDVKIRHHDAGDIYCIIDNILCDNPERRPLEKGQKPGGGDQDGRHIVKIVDAEAPLGEWNRMAFECKGRALRIWLNGVLVNDGYDCTTDHGKVALQVTEQRVEFRRVEVFPL
jgi:hypothetical protein